MYGILKDGNDNLYAKQKRDTDDFWTLWEKARVGCFETTVSKHVII